MKKISQSLIRELIDHHQEITQHCPLEIKEMYLLSTYEKESDAMTDGNYGEYLLLGGGARGKIVDRLPLTKRGEKPVREDRIRKQCLNANVKMYKHKMEVHKNVNTQVPLACYFENTDWVLLTELDLFPTPMLDTRTMDIIPYAIVDTKFCSDYSSFSYNAWDDYANMDKIQPDSIFYMFDNFNMELTKEVGKEFDERVGVQNIYTKRVLDNIPNFRFYYFVVCYKAVEPSLIRIYEHSKYEPTSTGNKLNNIKQLEFINRTKKAIEMLELYEALDYPAKPYDTKFKGCRKCLVNHKNGGYCKPNTEII